MKKECKYFIIILFLLYFNYSCSQKQNEIKSIVVDQFGYRYYLSEGRGTVYKIRMLNKANQLGQRYEGYLKEYKFNISHRSINYINKITTRLLCTILYKCRKTWTNKDNNYFLF